MTTVGAHICTLCNGPFSHMPTRAGDRLGALDKTGGSSPARSPVNGRRTSPERLYTSDKYEHTKKWVRLCSVITCAIVFLHSVACFSSGFRLLQLWCFLNHHAFGLPAVHPLRAATELPVFVSAESLRQGPRSRYWMVLFLICFSPSRLVSLCGHVCGPRRKTSKVAE